MRTRLWRFTNYSLDFDYKKLIGKKVKYIAYGNEVCPSTGRKHHQGFIYFKSAQRSVKSVAKLLGKCNVGPCDGSLRDNQDYCSKEGSLVEFGEKPKQGSRMDIADMMAGVKAGVTEVKLAEECPSLWCQYGKRLEHYRQLLQPRRHWKTEVYVYWGPAGSGKTRQAWEIGGEKMDTVQFANGFVIGYTNSPNVLIDDFDERSIPRHILLQLLDRYPCKVNVKGSEKEWNPRRIFLTTNDDPQMWWGGDPALQRRLTVQKYFGTANGTEVPSGNTGASGWSERWW